MDKATEFKKEGVKAFVRQAHMSIKFNGILSKTNNQAFKENEYNQIIEEFAQLLKTKKIGISISADRI